MLGRLNVLIKNELKLKSYNRLSEAQVCRLYHCWDITICVSEFWIKRSRKIMHMAWFPNSILRQITFVGPLHKSLTRFPKSLLLKLHLKVLVIYRLLQTTCRTAKYIVRLVFALHFTFRRSPLNIESRCVSSSL